MHARSPKRMPAFLVAGTTPIRYYNLVRFENISYPYFLALSLALHLTLVPMLWRKPFSVAPAFEPISVSFLPESKPLETQKAETPPPPARRRGEVARAKPLKRAPAAERKRPVAPPPEPQPSAPPLPPELPLRIEPPAEPAAIDRQARSDQESPMRDPEQAQASIFTNDAPERTISKRDLLPGRRDLSRQPSCDSAQYLGRALRVLHADGAAMDRVSLAVSRPGKTLRAPGKSCGRIYDPAKWPR